MRRRIVHGLAIMLSVASLGAGAADRPNNSKSPAPTVAPVTVAAKAPATVHKHPNKPYQVGTASWYGSYFQGKTTASGEPYNMNDFTAAHPKLPLGTMVKVTNLHNGRSAVVRINDRGPVVDGRIIDVSANVARALDFKSRGVQRVRLDLVAPETVAMNHPVASLP
jgi:rare lipoprotein A